MTEARSFLLEALRRIAEGGDIDNVELDAAIPDPLALPKDEKRAWEELSHWADDDDIRARDVYYADFKRRRMSDLISEMTKARA